jgi:hypothetical protein
LQSKYSTLDAANPWKGCGALTRLITIERAEPTTIASTASVIVNFFIPDAKFPAAMVGWF